MEGSTNVSSSSYSTSHTRASDVEEGDRLYYILITILVVILTAFMLAWGGQPQLTLAIIILFIIGGNLVYWMYERTESSVVWEQEEELSEELNLKMKDDSDLIRRAFQGMELSQSLLEKKIKNLFIEKLKDERNLSKEEVRELLQRPEKFRQVVDDEVISTFILSEETERGQKDYQEKIYRLIVRIERWE
ncbi:MAG: hypothetical protein ACOCTR_02580 [Candidatus Natronoplasma sp.]